MLPWYSCVTKTYNIWNTLYELYCMGHNFCTYILSLLRALRSYHTSMQGFILCFQMKQIKMTFLLTVKSDPSESHPQKLLWSLVTVWKCLITFGETCFLFTCLWKDLTSAGFDCHWHWIRSALACNISFHLFLWQSHVIFIHFILWSHLTVTLKSLITVVNSVNDVLYRF